MVRRSLLLISALQMVLALPLAAQSPRGFSADITIVKRTMTAKGKVFFDGDAKARVEITVRGRRTIAIADTAKQTAYVLLPRQRGYTEIGDAAVKKWSPVLRHYDPKNPCKNLLHTTCRKLGAERIDERLCTEWQFTEPGKNGNATTTIWIDQTTGVPAKLASNGTVTELSKIQPGWQDPGLFQIPAAYRNLDSDRPMQSSPRP